jgi:FKBP-type peptidyl-prolyl cis-trans isomerase
MNKKNIIISIILLIIVIGIAYLGYCYWKDSFAKDDNGIDKEINNMKQQKEITELKIEILKKGISGERISFGQTAVVHYTGWLLNGRKFDSSIDREEPFKFILDTGMVIQGWDIGVAGMEIGEKRKLTIPSNLAYGEQGIPGLIPSNSVLVFEVELLDIE